MIRMLKASGAVKTEAQNLPRQVHMVGSAFITERLTAAYEVPNKTSQSLPLTNARPNHQNRAARAAKSSLSLLAVFICCAVVWTG